MIDNDKTLYVICMIYICHVGLTKEILGPNVPGIKGKTVNEYEEGVQLDMAVVPKYV